MRSNTLGMLMSPILGAVTFSCLAIAAYAITSILGPQTGKKITFSHERSC